MDNITIVKATGDKEPFSEEKLRRSISRAGVPVELQEKAVSDIKSILHQNISTAEIYEHILAYLYKSSSPYTGSRYSLKKAIMDLGPTGFPFEKYIAAVLRKQGYKAETDVIVNGLCVAHEIDIIAQKQEEHKVMVECKFHNNLGSRTDIKVALYVMARYQDLTAGLVNRNTAFKFDEVWLVTNTKCSADTINYARCMGMKIISWGYPEKDNLQEFVEKDHSHPVTCLSSLNSSQKRLLLDNNIVLAKDLLTNNLFIELLKLSETEKNTLFLELQAL